ncbi:MAG: MscL family protein [Patescibacteria group bacterium]
MTISPRKTVSEFVVFIKEQGVVGLAVGFLIGGAVSKLVSAFILDIVTPLVGLAFGAVGSLKEATLQIGTATIAWGDFVSTGIDFIVIAAVVYIGIRLFGIEHGTKK